ncbi:MAG: ABC transporter permease subunit, partial [Fuerstiella sp.]|nr:ABC transporter permease subunit [Fuerstiella sp.]
MKLQAPAFLIRSLRQELRFVSHHVLRAGLAALVLLLFFGRVATFSMRAGVGGIFASNVMTCCYWFVTLLGGVYFCTAIVEEKEEQTLPLLKMTGASPAAILLGKSGPRLVSVLLLLLVVMPFLLLAITLGGVLPRGLLSATLGILAYAIMFCQLGLLASVVSRDFPRAFSKTITAWIVLEFLPFWCWLGS